jgi:hypothetical protein
MGSERPCRGYRENEQRLERFSMGIRTRLSYVLKHRPGRVSGYDCIEDHRYGMLLSNDGLVFIFFVATMIRIYDVIRMPNACTKL